MKITKKELSILYDALYDYGVELFMVEYNNPCTLGSGTCPHPEYDYCCGTSCSRVGKNGCKVKCLGCKLWLCHHLKEKLPDLNAKLSVARTLASFFWIGYVQNPKKDTIHTAFWQHKRSPRKGCYLDDTTKQLLSDLSDRDVRLSRVSRRVNELPRSQW